MGIGRVRVDKGMNPGPTKIALVRYVLLPFATTPLWPLGALDINCVASRKHFWPVDFNISPKLNCRNMAEQRSRNESA